MTPDDELRTMSSGDLDPAAWVIVLPLAMAALAFIAGPRVSAWASPAALVVQAGFAVALVAGVATGGARRLAIGGWEAPLGIALVADGLAVAMVMATSVVGLFVGLFARPYFAMRPGARPFWPLTWFLLGALNALFLSGDVFNLYVTLELVGLAAAGLVVMAGGAAPVLAGLRYLLVATAGSLLYLMGVALLYSMHGTLDLALLARDVTPGAGAWVAAALMTVGLLVKTALFPLHFWLPPAHGVAAAPASALLSALVIKGSYYLLLRLWLGPFEVLLTPGSAQFIGLLGAIAVIWGSLLALQQTRLKMLVAYSTVAQVGYLFLVFPLATDVPDAVAAAAYGGGAYLALSHALAKAAMFLAAGAIVLALGKDEIVRLEGVSGRQPLSLFAFGIAGITLMGLPPSGGFVGKWLLLEAALASGQWWWIVVLAGGGLLSAAYVFRVLRYAFLRVPGERPYHDQPVLLPATALVLAILALGLGPGADALLRLLSVAEGGAP